MMSFIFGKKRPPPEVYVAEETPEGFTPVISGNPYESPLPPYPPLPRPDAAGYPYMPPTPYPPQPSPYPPISSQASPYLPVSPVTPYTPASRFGPQSSAPSNPLDSIPFVLAPALTIARSRYNSDLAPIKNQMNQLKDRLATKYDYDFSLERSVIQDYSNGL